MTPSFASARAAVRRGRIVTAAALAGMAVVYLLALRYTPVEAHQGLAQKIFYLHVPAAWTALLIFSLMGIVSVIFLWLHDERLDLFAEASAEVGLMFSAIMLTTGPIWAKPIWGTWWAWWDVRLVSTLFLWFIYVSYLVLRGAVESPGLRARYSAILGILGALLIPFIHLSVYLFSTMHPKPIIGKPDKPSLPSEMLITFLISFSAFTLLYFAFLRSRYAYAVERDARAARIENA